MSDFPPPQPAQSGLSDNAAGALAYVTIIPAIIFLIVEPYNKNSYIRFHAWQSHLLGHCLLRDRLYQCHSAPRADHLPDWIADPFCGMGHLPAEGPQGRAVSAARDWQVCCTASWSLRRSELRCKRRCGSKCLSAVCACLRTASFFSMKSMHRPCACPSLAWVNTAPPSSRSAECPSSTIENCSLRSCARMRSRITCTRSPARKRRPQRSPTISCVFSRQV